MQSSENDKDDGQLQEAVEKKETLLTLYKRGALLFYDTVPNFNDLDKRAFENIEGKEKMLVTSIFSFSSMFFSLSTHYQTTNFRLFQTERVCRQQFQI